MMMKPKGSNECMLNNQSTIRESSKHKRLERRQRAHTKKNATSCHSNDCNEQIICISCTHLQVKQKQKNMKRIYYNVLFVSAQHHHQHHSMPMSVKSPQIYAIRLHRHSLGRPSKCEFSVCVKPHLTVDNALIETMHSEPAHSSFPLIYSPQ